MKKLFIGIVFTLLSSILNAQSLSDGLIAWYPLDHDALDYSGNGLHGTAFNNYWFEQGQVDSCIHVVGQGYMTSSGGHIIIPNLQLDTLDAFTISLWVNENGMSSWDGEEYIFFGDHGNGAVGIAHLGNNILFNVYDQGGYVPYNPNYLNNWVRYTLTYQNSNFFCYINDSLVDSGEAVAHSINSTSAIARHWWYNGGATSTRFIGNIDDVRIYGRCLSQQEVGMLAGSDPCPGPRISGTITYDNSPVNSPIPNAKLYLRSSGGQIIDSTTSNDSGTYSFCGVTPGTYTISMSENQAAGGINSVDALLCLKHFVGVSMLTGIRYKAGEVNNNGYINATDALIILRRFTEQILTFPIGNWIIDEASVTINPADQEVIKNITGLCVGDVNASFIP